MSKICKDCAADKPITEFTKGKGVCKPCISKKTAEKQKADRAVEKAVKIAAIAAKSPFDLLRDELTGIMDSLDKAASRDVLIEVLTEKLFKADLIKAKPLPKATDLDLSPVENVDPDISYLLIDAPKQQYVIIDLGKYVEAAKVKYPGTILHTADMALIDRMKGLKFTAIYYTPSKPELKAIVQPIAKTADQIEQERVQKEIDSVRYLYSHEIVPDGKYFTIYRGTYRYETYVPGHRVRVDMLEVSNVKVIAPESVPMALKHLCVGLRCDDVIDNIVPGVGLMQEVAPEFDSESMITRVKSLPLASSIDRNGYYVRADWEQHRFYFRFGKMISAVRPDLPMYEVTDDHHLLVANEIFTEVYDDLE